ncbi:MAG: hypothetical protein HY314_17290, partial [Acidobacteria bacterium]|nr:hypothetical protein [Acidobacteriota bacterium]
MIRVFKKCGFGLEATRTLRWEVDRGRPRTDARTKIAPGSGGCTGVPPWAPAIARCTLLLILIIFYGSSRATVSNSIQDFTISFDSPVGLVKAFNDVQGAPRPLSPNDEAVVYRANRRGGRTGNGIDEYEYFYFYSDGTPKPAYFGWLVFHQLAEDTPQRLAITSPPAGPTLLAARSEDRNRLGLLLATWCESGAAACALPQIYRLRVNGLKPGSILTASRYVVDARTTELSPIEQHQVMAGADGTLILTGQMDLWSLHYWKVQRATPAVTAGTCWMGGGGTGRSSVVPDNVPPEYQKLYAELQSQLEAFERELGGQGSGESQQIAFAAELLPANANRGEQLLTPSALIGSVIYLDALASLGVRGVKVAMSYPLLAPEFPRSSEYLAFYKQLAGEIKKRRMTLLVGAGVLFPDKNFSDLPVDYSDLTFQKLKEGRHQMARLIVEEIKPDYLTIGNEPSTEAKNTGLGELNDPERYTEMIQYILGGLKRGDTKIGAGTGSWDDPAFIRSFAARTDLDYIDLHIYPIVQGYLRRAVELAEVARAYNKKVVVGEGWLYKVGATELSLPWDQAFRRDVFSFWQPLDQKFLEILVKLAQTQRLEFVSAFWSKYFFAYLDYDERTSRMSYRELREQVDRAASQNIVAGRFSQTGLRYGQLIAQASGSGMMRRKCRGVRLRDYIPGCPHVHPTPVFTQTITPTGVPSSTPTASPTPTPAPTFTATPVSAPLPYWGFPFGIHEPYVFNFRFPGQAGEYLRLQNTISVYSNILNTPLCPLLHRNNGQSG